MLRAFWLACLVATLFFAFAPAEYFGLGGTGYHWLAFFVLTLCTAAAFPGWRLPVIWLLLVAIGGAIEIAQSRYFEERWGEWSDFRTNVAAVSTGILLVLLWRRMRPSRATTPLDH